MNILVFLGSVRDSTPPEPARLGLRVARACTALVADSGADVELVDPLDFDLGEVFKPHFAYRHSEVPAQLDDLAGRIAAADGYVMVSPEYNHSMSPALAHLLNHFGSSRFALPPIPPDSGVGRARLPACGPFCPSSAACPYPP